MAEDWGEGVGAGEDACLGLQAISGEGQAEVAGS